MSQSPTTSMKKLPDWAMLGDPKSETSVNFKNAKSIEFGFKINKVWI